MASSPDPLLPDLPFLQAVNEAEALIKQGLTVYQKFTCAHCGARQTIPDENKFFTQGQCEECQQVTDIRKHGCGYSAVGPPDVMLKALKERDGKRRSLQ